MHRFILDWQEQERRHLRRVATTKRVLLRAPHFPTIVSGGVCSVKVLGPGESL